MEKLLSIYPVAIEGEFAQLREFRANDAEALVACSQDQAVARFMRWAPQTLDEAHMLVEKSSADAQKVPRNRYHLAGVDLESGEMLSINPAVRHEPGERSRSYQPGRAAGPPRTGPGTRDLGRRRRIRVRAAARAPALRVDPRGEPPVAPLSGE